MRGRWLFWAAAWLAGCGGGAAAPDAGPTDAPGQACEVPSGHTFVLPRIHVAAASVGLDLDGDEEIDNVLGLMPEAARMSANEAFDASIAGGELLMLFHISDWSDPPSPTDPALFFDVFVGGDADMPLFPDDNFSGNEEFFVRLDQFGLDCVPAQRAEAASIEDRTLTATRMDDWEFVLSVNGAMVFTNATVMIDLSDDYASATGVLAAAVTICSLDKLPFPGDIEGTVLDVFANDALFSAVVPDMDLDGDGLERIVGDGVSILQCIDGDGTIITGDDCVCHPNIADGYSLAVELDAIGARLVGVR